MARNNLNAIKAIIQNNRYGKKKPLVKVITRVENDAKMEAPIKLIYIMPENNKVIIPQAKNNHRFLEEWLLFTASFNLMFSPLP